MEKYIEKVEEIRHRERSNVIYSLRSQIIERAFAVTKKLYGVNYVQYRGPVKVKMELILKFLSIKKLAI